MLKSSKAKAVKALKGFKPEPESPGGNLHRLLRGKTIKRKPLKIAKPKTADDEE